MQIPDAVVAILNAQHGVISRNQCQLAGMSRSTLETLVRSQRWKRLHQGVYSATSGLIDDDALLQAAVLAVPGAMVCNETALWLPKRRGPLRLPVHLAADAVKPPRPRSGIQLHLLTGLKSFGIDPPRMSYERALLEVISSSKTAAKVEHLVCQLVGDRVTIPTKIEKELSTRPRQPWRSLLNEMLPEVAAGAQSRLELLDLRNDRRHGLPVGQRQVRHRTGGQGRWLDVVVIPPDRPDLVVVKELDGRLGHESTGRFRDMARDNMASVSGGRPLRFGWADEYGEPCETAAWQILLWQRLGIDVGSMCGAAACSITDRVSRLAALHPQLSRSA